MPSAHTCRSHGPTPRFPSVESVKGGEKKKERNTLIGLNREYVKSVGKKSIINQDICKKTRKTFTFYTLYTARVGVM